VRRSTEAHIVPGLRGRRNAQFRGARLGNMSLTPYAQSEGSAQSQRGKGLRGVCEQTTRVHSAGSGHRQPLQTHSTTESAPSAARQLAIVPPNYRTSYQVGHCLIFDAASHTARRSGLFDAYLVGVGKNPYSVIWVAEDPEVIATGVGEFLQVCLVNTRAMQRVDKFVWRKRNFWGFRRSRRGSQEEGTKKRVQGPVRMWKSDRVTRGSLPDFRPRRDRSDGRKGRGRVEFEQDHE
jgi:hypothetical protein